MKAPVTVRGDLFAVIAMVLFCVCVFAQRPDWVRNFGQSARFPSQRYFTGFGTAVLNRSDPGESMRRAREHAMAEMLSSIRSDLSVTKKQNTTVINRYRANQELYSHFSLDYMSHGSLELEEIQNEFYVDKRRKVVFSFVRIDRTAAAKRIQHRAAVALMELQSLFRLSQNTIEQERFDYLRQLYGEVVSTVQTIKEHNSLCLVFDRGCTMDSMHLELLTLPQKIRATIAANPSEDLRAMASFLVFDLNIDKLESGGIAVVPFVKNGVVHGNFEQQVRYVLESTVAGNTNLSVVAIKGYPFVFNATRAAFDYALSAGASLLLAYGCYWRDSLTEVHLRLYDLRSGKLLRTSVDLFDTGGKEGVYSPVNRFGFDVWTAHGDSVIGFPRGFAVFVTADVPVYVRIVYRFENGLMSVPDPVFKNLYIDTGKRGGEYRLPGLFSFPDVRGEVVVFASRKPFPEIGLIRLEYGGEVIGAIDEGSHQAVAGYSSVERRLRVEVR